MNSTMMSQEELMQQYQQQQQQQQQEREQLQRHAQEEQETINAREASRRRLNEIIQINNTGVMNVLSNRDEQAVQDFSSALTILKQMMVHDAQTLLSQHETLEEDTEDETMDSPDSSMLHSATYPLHEYQSSNFFLFDCLVYLRPLQANDQQGSHRINSAQRQANNHVYCASIIMNLALLYHRQALINRGTKGHEALLKAERFYSMVMKIIGNSNANRGTELLVKLGAINNLSEIYLVRGDLNSADEGFQTLAWIVGSTSANQQAALVAPEVIEGMLLNALIVNRQTVAPAA